MVLLGIKELKTPSLGSAFHFWDSLFSAKKCGIKTKIFWCKKCKNFSVKNGVTNWGKKIKEFGVKHAKILV